MKLFELFATLSLDTNEFDRGIKSAQRTGTTFANTMAQKVSAGTVALGNLIARGVESVAKATYNFSKDIVQISADVAAEKAQFEATFKGIEQAANSSFNAVSEDTGILATRLKNVGTKAFSQFKGSGMDAGKALAQMDRYTRLAADAAAYYDISLEDADTRLRSFLRGNVEAGDAIGLFTSESQRNTYSMKEYGKAWKDLTESQKQMLMLNVAEDIYKQSGAIGQAARESDGWANVVGNLKDSWRQSQAVLGDGIRTKLIPLLQSMTAYLKDEKTQENLKAFGDKLGEIAGYTFGGLQSALQWVLDNQGNISQVFTDIKNNGASAVGDWIKKIVLGDGYTVDSSWGDVGADIWTTIKGGIKVAGDWIFAKVLGDAYVPGESWGAAGGKVWDAFLKGFGDAASNGIANATAFMDKIAAVLNGTDFSGEERSGKGFADFFAGIADEVNRQAEKTDMGAFFSSLMNLSSATSTNLGETAGSFVAAFVGGLNSEENSKSLADAGGNILDSVVSGISSVVTAKDFIISGLKEGFLNGIKTSLPEGTDVSAAVTTWWNLAMSGLTSLGGLILPGFTPTVPDVSGAVEEIRSWWASVTSEAGLGRILVDLGLGPESVETIANPAWWEKNVTTPIVTAWNKVKGAIDSAIDSVKTFLGLNAEREQDDYVNYALENQEPTAMERYAGRYAHWTEAQQNAARDYIGMALKKFDTGEEIAELKKLGISDEAVIQFQKDVSDLLSSGEYTTDVEDAMFEPQAFTNLQGQLSKTRFTARVDAVWGSMGGITYGKMVDLPGFATGLPNVPYDNFPALLHRGEGVLTRSENREYQSGQNRQSVDQASLVSAVTTAIKDAFADVAIVLNGERVGDAVTSRVSRNIAQDMIAGRFA